MKPPLALVVLALLVAPSGLRSQACVVEEPLRIEHDAEHGVTLLFVDRTPLGPARSIGILATFRGESAQPQQDIVILTLYGRSPLALGSPPEIGLASGRGSGRQLRAHAGPPVDGFAEVRFVAVPTSAWVDFAESPAPEVILGDERYPLPAALHAGVRSLAACLAARGGGVPEASADTTRLHRNDLKTAFYSLIFAPAGIATIEPRGDGEGAEALGFMRDHLAVTAGGSALLGADARWRDATAVAASVELLAGGWIAALGTESSAGADLEVVTARVGRLWHPRPDVAGGVTVGYRESRGALAEQGVEIAFPLVVGGGARWLRVDAAYAVSQRRISWDHRVRGEQMVRGTPLFVGFDAALPGIRIDRDGGPDRASLGFLAGTRVRLRPPTRSPR